MMSQADLRLPALNAAQKKDLQLFEALIEGKPFDANLPAQPPTHEEAQKAAEDALKLLRESLCADGEGIGADAARYLETLRQTIASAQSGFDADLMAEGAVAWKAMKDGLFAELDLKAKEHGETFEAGTEWDLDGHNPLTSSIMFLVMCPPHGSKGWLSCTDFGSRVLKYTGVTEMALRKLLALFELHNHMHSPDPDSPDFPYNGVFNCPYADILERLLWRIYKWRFEHLPAQMIVLCGPLNQLVATKYAERYGARMQKVDARVRAPALANIETASKRSNMPLRFCERDSRTAIFLDIPHVGLINNGFDWQNNLALGAVGDFWFTALRATLLGIQPDIDNEDLMCRMIRPLTGRIRLSCEQLSHLRSLDGYQRFSHADIVEHSSIAFLYWTKHLFAWAKANNVEVPTQDDDGADLSAYLDKVAYLCKRVLGSALAQSGAKTA